MGQGRGEIIPNTTVRIPLADTEHFRYLQIRHALYSVLTKSDNPPESSPLEDRILDGHMPSNTISLTYKKLTNATPEPLKDLKEKWEGDGLIIEEEDWVEAIASPREVAISARLRLVQLKILHRIYVTTQFLYNIGKADTNKCRRGWRHMGTFLHTLRECPLIQVYWKGIHDTITAVLGAQLTLEARRCILNVWEPTDLNSKQIIWVTLALMVAKRNIAQKWGAIQPPTVSAWKKDMDWCMFREKIVYIARRCPRKWNQILTEWNVYRGDICTPPADDPNMYFLITNRLIDYYYVMQLIVDQQTCYETKF